MGERVVSSHREKEEVKMGGGIFFALRCRRGGRGEAEAGGRGEAEGAGAMFFFK